jgi:hypothetical protein
MIERVLAFEFCTANTKFGFTGAEQYPFGLGNPFQQGPPHHHQGHPGLRDRKLKGFFVSVSYTLMHSQKSKIQYDFIESRVSNIVVHPLNESTLQIDFTVSPILVGLQGHVEVLYTSEFM